MDGIFVSYQAVASFAYKFNFKNCEQSIFSYYENTHRPMELSKQSLADNRFKLNNFCCKKTEED